MAFSDFATADFSWVAKIASLLVLPFAHEDLAIIFGGYFIVNHLMPVSLVAACIYGGMVVSDFALYGIGVGARRLPWLSRYAINHRVRRFSETLKRNIFLIVALCRVVPGVVFVAFVACGWARVSLARFAAASFIVSAIYLPLVLYLVIFFDDALSSHLGLWTWPMMLLVIGVTSFARKSIFAFHDNADLEAELTVDAVLTDCCRGMPRSTAATAKWRWPNASLRYCSISRWW